MLFVLTRRDDSTLAIASARAPAKAGARQQVDVGFVDVEHGRIGVAPFNGIVDSGQFFGFSGVFAVQGRARSAPHDIQPTWSPQRRCSCP